MRPLKARLGKSCGRHPLFAAALVAAACIVAANEWPFAGFAMALTVAAAGASLRGWRCGAAWLLAGLVSAGVITFRKELRDERERVLLQAPAGSAQGVALADGRSGGNFWSAAVVLESPRSGVKVWWQGRGDPPVAGSRVTGHGNFQPIPPPRNPGEFDQAAWLKGQDVAAVFNAAGVPGEVSTGWWAARGAQFRRAFRAAVTAGLAEESQEAIVIRAVVIGEQPPDADALVAAFRNSGTLHAFSVSGLHVAMVGTIAWFVLRLLGVPRKWAVPILLPLIFGYSWLTGNSPPAVRSAWMAAIFLGAFVTRRRPDLLNALGAVFLVAALWDGRLLFQPGVQLSYGVVAVIAIAADRTTRWFSWLGRPERYLPPGLMNRRQKLSLGLRRGLAKSFGVSVAAGVGSTPLTALHFGLITPISVLAGVFFVPEVFALLATAMGSAALSPFLPATAAFLNGGNARIAKACVLTAETFSAVPGGHFQIQSDRRPALLVYDLEHGAGAACFYDTTGAVLLDCGDPYTFKRRVAPSLRRMGITPDSVVLSHPDGGHLGGGAKVWEIFPIRQVLLPVSRSRSPAFRAWTDKAPAAGIKTLHASTLQSLPMPDGARLEILSAPDPLARDTIADNRVAIYRLHWRGWKILFTSDAGMGAELDLLARGTEVSADVIVAGKHGTDASLCDAFIAAVRPRAIVASNAAFPPEERLDPAAAAYWKSQGIAVFDQGKSGGVTIRVEGSNLTIQGFADQSSVVLTGR